jgi:hydrogenase-1 operon protein HyaF
MMNPEIETLLSALVGPGSQPDGPDDAKLDYMIMPEEMRVFLMASIPADAADHAAGVAAGEAILAALNRVAAGGPEESVDLAHLAPADLAFVDQLLGEGEVSVVLGDSYQAQNRCWRACGACAGRASGAATGGTLAPFLPVSSPPPLAGRGAR